MQTQLATPLRHLMCLSCEGKEKQMHLGRRYKEKKDQRIRRKNNSYKKWK